jgi:hypothetical protein
VRSYQSGDGGGGAAYREARTRATRCTKRGIETNRGTVDTHDTAPPFLTYSELGGLPQDPQCGAESCPRSQEVAEGGFCKVRDLLSTYRVSPGLEPMVGHAVASCGTRRGGAAAWTAIAQPTDLIVLNRRLRTARLGAVRPTSCDRRLRHRFAERPIAAARPRI